MSLEIDGVWKAGVWAPTIWASGVWAEHSLTPAIDQGGGGARKRRRKVHRGPASSPLQPEHYFGHHSSPPIETMSQSEIQQEMWTPLHRKLRKDEEERAVMLLLALLA